MSWQVTPHLMGDSKPSINGTRHSSWNRSLAVAMKRFEDNTYNHHLYLFITICVYIYVCVCISMCYTYA